MVQMTSLGSFWHECQLRINNFVVCLTGTTIIPIRDKTIIWGKPRQQLINHGLFIWSWDVTIDQNLSTTVWSWWVLTFFVYTLVIKHGYGHLPIDRCILCDLNANFVLGFSAATLIDTIWHQRVVFLNCVPRPFRDPNLDDLDDSVSPMGSYENRGIPSGVIKYSWEIPALNI